MKYESDKKEYAKSLVERYMQKIYAFSLKRTNNLCDAEDLAQEIVLKIYKASVIKDIINEEAFVWSVVKNVFANYYRDKASKKVIFMENLGEIGLTDKKDILDEVLEEMKVSINSYKEIIIRNTPKHLRKSQLFLLQNMFHSDGLLMNYMRRNLIESKKLKPVSKEQQDSLSMMLIYWK